jgi:hypothetical protein
MMGAAGLTFWLIIIHFGFLTAFSTPGSAAQEVAGYGVADLGCVLIFLACLGVPGSHVPAKITYLGKISYGLTYFILAFCCLSSSGLPTTWSNGLGC